MEVMPVDPNPTLLSLSNLASNGLVPESSKECHQVFRTTEYESHKARNPDRVEGTCKWFLKHEKYTEWQKPGSSLLWVSADPGCGKSVLSKSLVEKELHESTQRATCYFFFKDDDEDQGTATNALCALIHQLFTQRPSLVKHAENLYNANKDKLRQNFHLLWKILTMAAADPQAGEIVCLLDALDECKESERKRLISTICTFYQSVWNSERKMALKFLITSRPYSSIEMDFARLTSKVPTIRLAGEDKPEEIREEIDLVVSKEVESITQELYLDPGDVVLLRQQLSRVKHWTYLWLKLILDLIRADFESLTRRENREKIFYAIPDSVEAAYTAILNKSPDKARARRLLSIICVAIRPLSVREVSIALMIEPHHRTLGDLELPSETRAKILIRNLCGLFVSVINGKVYLLHQTAKEFLVSQNELASGLCPNEPWKYSLTTTSSNLLLAQICVWYLLLSEFDTYIPVLEYGYREGEMAERQKLISRLTSRHAFLEYSAANWAAHFRTSMIQENSLLIDSALRVCATTSQRFKTWFFIFWDAQSPSWKRYYKFPKGLEIIHVASILGLDGVVQRLLATPGVKVDGPGERNRTPLSWAAQMGHKAVMITLLKEQENRAEITEDVLMAAVGNGKEVVMLLLEHQDKEIKITDKVVEAAANNYRSGSEVIMLLLEQQGHNFEITNQLLQTIARFFDEDVVSLLLDRRGEDIEITNKVVEAAVTNSRAKEVITLLLDRRGNEVKITEVVEAAAGSYYGKEIIPMLLSRRGGAIKITEEAIKVAAGNSDIGEEVMKLLLDGLDGDVKITDEVFNAITGRSKSGKEIMKLLLDRQGHNLEITDLLLQTILGSPNFDNIVGLLLRQYRKNLDIESVLRL